MNKTLKLVLFLAVVSALSGLLIGVVNSFTEPVINEHAIEAEKANLELMYPGEKFTALDYTDPNGVVIGAYKVSSKGYIFKATAVGYNNSTPIIVLVGLDNNGTIVKVVALQQQETKGFGSKCFEPENIKSLYVGKTVDQEVDMLAGASFTSTAMKNIMTSVQEAYGKVK